MVTLTSVVRPLASQLYRHFIKHTRVPRLTPVRRCNLAACSSKYVLSKSKYLRTTYSQKHTFLKKHLKLSMGLHSLWINSNVVWSFRVTLHQSLVTCFHLQSVARGKTRNGVSSLLDLNDRKYIKIVRFL